MKRKFLILFTTLIAFCGLLSLGKLNNVIVATGDATTVQHDYDALVLPSTSIMSFPVTYISVYGNTIEWSVEANQEVITYDEEAHWMVVDRSKVVGTNVNIKVYATITGEGESNSQTKEFTVNVPAGYTASRKFTLSFDLAGGTSNVTLPTEYKLGQASLTLPTDITKDGFVFDGWYDGNTKVEKVLVGSQKNYSLTAHWVKGITSSMISAISNVTYTGSALEPTIVVTDNATQLILNTDYTVAYSNNTNAGQATVTVTGIGNYSGVATANFTIDKKAPTITANNVTVDYDTTSHTVSATVDSEGVISYKLGENDFTGAVKAGTYTITVNVASTANYTEGSKEVTLTINKINPTPQVGTHEYNYDGNEKSVVVTSNSTGQVTYEDNSRTDAGEQVVSYTIAEDDNYKSYSGTVTLKINKVAPTITVNTLSFVYNGSNQMITATRTGDGVVSYTLGDTAFTGATDVATYQVKVSVAEGTNYLSGEQTFDMVITKADPVITVSGVSVTYDGLAHSISGATVTGNGEITYSANNTLTNVGSQTVTVYAAESANYKAGSTTTTLEVTKAALTVTPKPQSVNLGGTIPTIGLNDLTYTSFVNNETSAVLGGTLTTIYQSNNETVTPSASGTYDIVISGLTSDNYEITFAKGVLTISDSTLDIRVEASELSKVYNNENQTFTAKVYDGNNEVEGLTLSYKVNNEDFTGATNVSSQQVVVSFSDDNFGTKSETFTFVITPKAITVTITNKTSVYGETLVDLGDPSIDGVIDGTDAQVTITKEDGNTAGTYAITATVANSNYTNNGTNGAYTITKRPVTITGSSASSQYGDTLESISASITSGSLVAADDLGTISATCNATSTSACTDYDVVPTYTENSNYEVTVVNGTYQINKREVTITLTDKTSAYSDVISTLGHTLSKTLVNADDLGTITCSTDATTSSPVGTYDINATYTSNSNYTVTVVKGTYTVTQKDLTSLITAIVDGTDFNLNDATRLQPTVTVKFTGTENVITSSNYTLAYVGNDVVGTATINVTFTGNYTGTASTTFEITQYGQAAIDGAALYTAKSGTLTGRKATLEALPLIQGSSSIAWTSNSTAVKVNPDGSVVITSAEEDAEITLTATLTCGQTSYDTQVFTFIVPATPITVTDDTTDIVVEGAPKGSTISVTVVEESQQQTYQGTINLTHNSQVVAAYDISLTKDSTEVQPDETVTVKIPTPAGVDYNEVRIYYVDGNTVQEMTITNRTAEFITFTTTHFSAYVVSVARYNLLFDANTGSGTMDVQKFVKGTPQNISACTLTAPEGKEFDKWNTLADGTGTDYAEGASISLTENITLYAIWKDSTPVYSPTVVIYEVYGAGGNTDAIYKNDYVILKNMTNEDINLTGKSLQYASATSTSNFSGVLALTGTIPANGYYKVVLAGGSNGIELPFTADQSDSSINMGGSNLKLALINSTDAIKSNEPTNILVIDYVGAGTANTYLGSNKAPAPTVTKSIIRKAYTGDNESDYENKTFGTSDDFAYLLTGVKLNAPVIAINEAIVSWSAIENANGYDVYNDTTKLNTELITSLSYTLEISEVGSHNITVKAVGDNVDYRTSDSSNVEVYTVNSPVGSQIISCIMTSAATTGTATSDGWTVQGSQKTGYIQNTQGQKITSPEFNSVGGSITCKVYACATGDDSKVHVFTIRAYNDNQVIESKTINVVGQSNGYTMIELPVTFTNELGNINKIEIECTTKVSGSNPRLEKIIIEITTSN